ncbi:MAG: hypothetical protein CMJ35_03545 [Phycisphaerae bacterium]|nr:hypothetical protein [Phycisphaerae bacterium]HCT44523.1 hypothetical protein [Phycisphaerales bacterium]|tara:strand:+ start:56 stop:817 length:762 start_codon:yes stop_codon:yes gene_type:complete
MNRFLLTTCAVLSLLTLPAMAQPETPAFVHESTDSYTTQQMLGFTVRVSAAAMAHPDTTEPALELLEEELAEVLTLTPEHTHETLRRVTIWIEHNAPEHPCACYHPGRQWLIDNGFNPDKEKGIEIANPKNFVEWTKQSQPLMVLHELAHAYHDLALGFEHPLIASCFAKAEQGGKYDEVMHVSGNPRKHYALSNDREYFAELTESYFGKNDFAPFTRDELRDFDPDGYAMIEALWLHPAQAETTKDSEKKSD